VNRDPSSRLTIRAAILLGFGLTLGLWVFAGYGFATRIAGAETDAAAINSRYMRTQLLLSGIRAQVLLGSVVVRDALLDPEPDRVAGYEGEVQKALAGIDDLLGRYVPVVDSAQERARLSHLRRELADFRVTVLGLLASAQEIDAAAARLELSRQVVARREGVIRVSEQVQELNRAAFIERQTQLAEMSAQTQRRLWEQLGLSVLGSLGIALLASGYAGRLEQRLLRQQVRDLRLTKDLQRLSAKLVEAQEEERRTIARELHDEVGQSLTALRMEIDAAQRKLRDVVDVPELNAAQSIAESTLTDVRDLSRLLHPAVLDDLGLPAALESYLRGFETRTGIRIRLQIEGMEERLSGTIEGALYRIVQEATTNVAKHARATLCHVTLARNAGAAVLAIEDDGAGFALDTCANPDPGRGLGLIGIRERVTQVGGTFFIDSGPGLGTRLTVTIPVHLRARVLMSTFDPSPALLSPIRSGDMAGG
jgi:signal transduction histidine kinase